MSTTTEMITETKTTKLPFSAFIGEVRTILIFLPGGGAVSFTGRIAQLIPNVLSMVSVGNFNTLQLPNERVVNLTPSGKLELSLM